MAAQQTFTPQQTNDIKNIIHNYLVNENPETLVEASNALRQKQANQQQEQASSAINANIQSIFYAKNSPSIGPDNAPVTVVEFFDYQCGHCKTMAKKVSKALAALGDKDSVRFVYKEFPIFQNSDQSAKAALAANMQNGYYSFHKSLMANKKPTSDDAIKSGYELQFYSTGN